MAQYRHLIHKGGQDTVCGSTASHPDVWRGSNVKENCPACQKYLEQLAEMNRTTEKIKQILQS